MSDKVPVVAENTVDTEKELEDLLKDWLDIINSLMINGLLDSAINLFTPDVVNNILVSIGEKVTKWLMVDEKQSLKDLVTKLKSKTWTTITEEKFNETITLIDKATLKNDDTKVDWAKPIEATPEEIATLKTEIMAQVDSFKTWLEKEFDKIINSLFLWFWKIEVEKNKEEFIKKIEEFSTSITSATTVKDVLQIVRNNIDLMKTKISKSTDKEKAKDLISFVNKQIPVFEKTLADKQTQFGLTIESSPNINQSNESSEKPKDNTILWQLQSIGDMFNEAKDTIDDYIYNKWFWKTIIFILETIRMLFGVSLETVVWWIPWAESLKIFEKIQKLYWEKFTLDGNQKDLLQGIYNWAKDFPKDPKWDYDVKYKELGVDWKTSTEKPITIDKKATQELLKSQFLTKLEEKDDQWNLKNWNLINYDLLVSLCGKDGIEIEENWDQRINTVIKKIVPESEIKTKIEMLIDKIFESKDTWTKVLPSGIEYINNVLCKDATKTVDKIDTNQDIAMLLWLYIMKWTYFYNTVEYWYADLPNKGNAESVKNVKDLETKYIWIKFESASNWNYKVKYGDKYLFDWAEKTVVDLTEANLKIEIKKYEEAVLKAEFDNPDNWEEWNDKNYPFLSKVFVSDTDFTSKLTGDDEITKYKYLAEHLEDYKGKKDQIKKFFEYLKTVETSDKKKLYNSDLDKIINNVTTYTLANNGWVIVLKEVAGTDNDSSNNIKIENWLASYLKTADSSTTAESDTSNAESSENSESVWELSYPLGWGKVEIHNWFWNTKPPLYSEKKPHIWIDLDANRWDSVFSVQDWTILEVWDNNTNAWFYVKIKWKDGTNISYCHLKEKSTLKVWDYITSWDPIWIVWKTCWTSNRVTEEHLHLTFRKGKDAFDPLEEWSKFKDLFDVNNNTVWIEDEEVV